MPPVMFIFPLGATWTMLKTFGCLCSAATISCCVCCGFQHEQHVHRVKWGLMKKGLGKRPHTAVLQKCFQKKHRLSVEDPWGLRCSSCKQKNMENVINVLFLLQRLEGSEHSEHWLKVQEGKRSGVTSSWFAIHLWLFKIVPINEFPAIECQRIWVK